jgi:hypothetical protein
MNKELIEKRKNLEKIMKKEFKKVLKNENVKDNYIWLENISLSIETIIVEEIKNSLFSIIKDKELREFLKNGIIDNDLYPFYEYMDNKIYLSIIKEIALYYENENMSNIKKFKKEYFKEYPNYEEIDFSPMLEIQLNLNFREKEEYPIKNIDLEYNDPIILFGDRLIYSDETINPNNSIMINIYI